MKITAPVSRLEEIAVLAAAGADELYCGVIPREWVARFRTGAVNRRYFGNLTSLEELAAAVAMAHGHGARLFMVLNAQHYGAAQHEALIELAGEFHRFGGDAVIVADIALVAELGRLVPSLALHVSSVAGCRNSSAITLYRSLGARRVILPRDVTLEEIEGMARNAGAVELEAFVLNDGCVFEEATCHAIHLPPGQGGPICMDRRPFRYRTADGGDVPARTVHRLRRNEADYERWLWYRFGCGFGHTPQGDPYGPCGLCAVSRLAAAGVASVKIAGREAATERKLSSVRMVRSVVERVHRGEDAGDIAAFAQGIRHAEEHCRCGFMCYYPEVRRA